MNRLRSNQITAFAVAVLRAIGKPILLTWRGLIEPLLVKHLTKKIVDHQFRIVPTVDLGPESSNNAVNLCGLGGQTKPLTKSWNVIYDEYENTAINWTLHSQTLGSKERLFFCYFAPLEHWCEQHLSHNFALWHDQSQVYLFLFHEADQLYFNLRWNGDLPKARDL